MNRTLKIVLPLLVVAVAALIAYALVLGRPEPETRIPDVPLPVVRVQPVKVQDLRLTVNSQGTVSPRTESVLVPEVSGSVIEVAPAFAAGGFFEAGERLLRIDPHDYRQSLVQARATVAQAELRLAQQQAEAQIAIEEWADLGQGEASPLTRFEPQLADAEAALLAAGAALERAQRDLERTEIRAPYAGRVREKLVDLGQFVTRGARLATIYAVDFAEIQLSIPDSELAYVELPLVYRGQKTRAEGPEVLLRASFAGRRHEWRGRIVRTEGEIDPRSRMVRAVVQVKDPYARGSDPDRPPLAAGLYVEAEIQGRLARDVVVLPRSSLRDDGTVLVLDSEDRLHFRPVEVLRRTQTEIVVESGLVQGERVCLSALTAVTEGMRVRVPDSQPEAAVSLASGGAS